jgi:hypothetical protein
LAAASWACAEEGQRELALERSSKPRLVVLTDMSADPDDEQSLVRLLLYSNEIELEGLIATTSVWLKNRVRPDLIRRRIEAYGAVRETLLRHAAGYPTKEQLLSVTKAGLPLFGLSGVGKARSSPGSRHIVQVADAQDDRPLWVAIWGGANCLAQALWEVQTTRSPAELAAFVAKLRVYAISDQDDSGRWIRARFPDLFYIVSPTPVNNKKYRESTWSGISGDRIFGNGPGHRFELVDNPWLRQNVIEDHGPLGKAYPEIRYLMEGDTPSFLNLIGNGLEGHLRPSYGGWGGRYELRRPPGEPRPIWTNSLDTVAADDGSLHTSAQATIWRWREDFQHDFAARMDWTVARRYRDANHNPSAVVNGQAGTDVLHLRARPGDRVRLSAEGSADPDGDPIFFQWLHYPEAGGAGPQIEIDGADSPEAAFVVPTLRDGQTLHVLLKVRDSGEPSLVSYRRVIVETGDAGDRGERP